MASKGRLSGFTHRITGGGRNGKKQDMLDQAVRQRNLRERGEVPEKLFGNISAGLPKTGRARKSGPLSEKKMGANLRGRAP